MAEKNFFPLFGIFLAFPYGFANRFLDHSLFLGELVSVMSGLTDRR